MNASALPAAGLPLLAPGKGLQLLRGVRILDLTTSIAGPYGTMLLADMGAEVIKIERPGSGDDSRHWRPPDLAGKALWFTAVNRNKRSVTLDYAKPQGHELLMALVRRSDVIVTNQLPAVQAKLKVGYDAIRAVRPDIVYVSLTGFGLTGERASRPCYDLIAEGYSGIMDMTGELEREPQKIGTPAADLLAGVDCALGCLGALFDRAATGQGHLVEIALVDSAVRFMSPRLVPYLGSGELPRRSGAKDSVIAIYQVFETATEPLTLGVPNENCWRKFCRAVKREDLLADAALSDNAGRVAQRARLVGEVAAILRQQPRDHWLALFTREGVPAGPINRLDEVAADRELHERGLLFAMDVDGTAFPQVGLGIRFDHQAAGWQRPPPDLGQDNADVLQGMLGLDAARLAQLKTEGLI